MLAWAVQVGAVSLGCQWCFFPSCLTANCMLQAKPQEHQPHLPEELLVAVFNALDHPSDLLACARVCKAWRTGTSKALLPKLDLNNDDLTWLLRLSPIQMAAVREVDVFFVGHDRKYATASAMLFTFICARLPMLQRLGVDCEEPYIDQEEFAEVNLHF